MVKNLENKEIFSKNLVHYMNKNNVDRNTLCEKLNLKYMTVSDWINAKTYPRIDKIELLSDFFGINKSDLIEDKLSSQALSLTPDEQDLLSNFNKSNLQGKQIILDTAKTMSKTYAKPSRQEMIDYLRELPRAAYGGAKNVFNMTDEELETEYDRIRKDFEDD